MLCKDLPLALSDSFLISLYLSGLSKILKLWQWGLIKLSKGWVQSCGCGSCGRILAMIIYSSISNFYQCILGHLLMKIQYKHQRSYLCCYTEISFFNLWECGYNIFFCFLLSRPNKSISRKNCIGYQIALNCDKNHINRSKRLQGCDLWYLYYIHYYLLCGVVCINTNWQN